MRVSGQLAVIAVLGAAGFGGWYAYKEGYLAKVPVVGSYCRRSPPAAGRAARRRARRPRRAPPTVEVDTVKTGRIVEIREAVGTVRAFESITVTAKVAGIIDEIGFEEGQKVKAGDVLVAARCRRAQGRDRAGRRREPTAPSALRNEIAIRLERAQALQPHRRRHRGAGRGSHRPGEVARRAPSPPPRPSARRAEARLEDLIIRAPFAGRVGTRSVSLGAYISPGHPDHHPRRPLEGPARLLGAGEPPRPPQAGPGRERHLGGLQGPGLRGHGGHHRPPRRSGRPAPCA